LNGCFGIYLGGGFPVRSVGRQQRAEDVFIAGERDQRTRHGRAEITTEEAMLDVLGADGKQIVSSGDEIETAQNRAIFRAKIPRNAPFG